ncbi:hypothetical protein AQUCO_01700453v1 [Aquilegia coerulea]|uniref:Uncharacterized protein n=1 Tax=Aquilegia coerulea TaxID=218851 RepID=A0A2G5DN14_AQUCA|nr:hypothetical protein AQUCO_01700453v1 [Aquilegia coerulea]
MLLSPRSDSELKYRNLVLDLININDHMKYYACPSFTCATEAHSMLSLFENARCLCGQEMQELGHTAEELRDRVAFVEGDRKFIITDDLHISIVSTEARELILRRRNIIEGISIEERFVHLGTREVLKLLKHSLVSKTPMTDVILGQGDILTSMVKSDPYEYLKLQIYPQTEKKRINLKLLVQISSNTVLYAVANEDFLDFLFSFLTFPVGTVVELLDGFSSIGSIDNLYRSVEDLCSRSPETFTECKDLLLRPMVAWHHGCENQILQIKEGNRLLERFKIKLINPKYDDTVYKRGRGFIRKPMKFMVSDELYVLPYSPMSSICFLNRLGAQRNDLEERFVTVGEQQAMSILKASLTTTTALTNVFCQKSEGAHSCFCCNWG